MERPEIRFKGYTDEWEQRKLIEVCDYVDYRGKTPTKTENGIFLVTAKNVKDGFIDYETSKEYISENAYEEVMRRGKPEIGDVLITTEAPCGNVAQVNKADIALAQRIIKYRGHIGVVDNTYLKYYLLSPEFQKILNAKSSGGTVQGIKGSILHQQKIIYPSYEEQKKIGQHMDSLDHLITLHQRKCDEVKSLKKYMLQKMFPQNEQKVPEIRFKGFTEAWEQRKLEDFGKATGGTSIESEFSEDGIYKVVSIGSYSENSVYNDQGIRAIKSDKTSNRVLNRNDLTMILNDKTTSGNIIGRVLLIEESGIYVYNQRTERIEINLDEYDPVFLYEMLNAPNIREKIIKQAQGNTQIYVNWTAISLLEYMIPSKEEQVKIGEYLHNISNLITLHQQKCEELKKIKKFMLQKMFV